MEVWHGRGSLTGASTREWAGRMACRGCPGYENDGEKSRGGRERRNLRDLGQKIDICSWNVPVAKGRDRWRLHGKYSAAVRDGPVCSGSFSQIGVKLTQLPATSAKFAL